MGRGVRLEEVIGSLAFVGEIELKTKPSPSGRCRWDGGAAI